jgi:hypothetical protein
MAEQAAPLVKIETCGDVVIATDAMGRKFSTPVGAWDWRPLVEPPPPVPPKSTRDRRAGGPI